MLYSSVPTDDNELREIHDVINSRISTSTHITVTPDIIKQCIHKLKPGKDDGDVGFKSDHIINGSHSLHILLSLLYNLMLSSSSSSRVATSHFCHPLLHTSLRSVIVYQQVISCTRLWQEWAV